MSAISPDSLYVILLAPFVGSFLGVLIKRLPKRLPVAFDRSRCDDCNHILGPLDLVPLISFVALRGKCRFCSAPIGLFYVSIELAALTIAVIAIAMSVDPAVMWFGCVLGWALLALAWIDWGYMILPDVLTLPLILLGLFATYWLDPGDITDHALAAAFGYLAFRAIAVLYRRIRGRDGLGEGDAKLMAAAGSWVGIGPLPYILIGGAVLTLAAAALKSWWSRQSIEPRMRLPLGAGLCLALWIVWVFASSSIMR
ncbi:prepilin peptidase [Acidisoma cellulosilytica]|uniref:Prepilin leader peptidase/N-methyltransferase n=1 Tax=Acidisoma cellulosilyticum TaxID=2802395 RepID=A0A964E6M8_9PROT|nr:A24 family peptidase [Acidisoma cellulosilyticum]MCB8883173.1 prepilin peptidase [Acidisoma cellulosilyticum]